MFAAWCHVPANLDILSSKKKKTRKYEYNLLCNADEEATSGMVNAELDIDSDDEMDLEIEGGTASEESSIEKSGSQR
jgi:hypothetical protein